MRDLAPEIHRQRLVVEGLVTVPIVEDDSKVYLKELGCLTDLRVLAEPVTNRSPLFGWAAWVRDVGFGIDALTAGANRRATLALRIVLFGAFRDNQVASLLGILDVGARRPIASLGVQMLDLPGALPAPYLGSSASVPVYRHVRDLHRLHLSRFADFHQHVFRGRDVIGMDPRECQPGAFGLEAA
jgi:hypothetical protein